MAVQNGTKRNEIQLLTNYSFIALHKWHNIQIFNVLKLLRGNEAK